MAGRISSLKPASTSTKRFCPRILDRPHLGQQHGAFGDKVAARLDLQLQRVANEGLGLAARRVPQAEVMLNIDTSVAIAIGNGQAAARRDRMQVMPCRDRLAHQADHGLAHLRQVLVVDAGTDVHVQANELEPMAVDCRKRLRQIGMPDAMLAVLAARVGLVAVAVAEAGVDAQPDGVAGRRGAELVEHVDGAGVDGNAVLDDGGQCGVVQQVRREDDLVTARFVASSQGAQDLAARHRVDLDASFAQQLQDVDVGAGLLCKAHHVETLQRRRAGADGGGVIDPKRRAVFGSQGLQAGGVQGGWQRLRHGSQDAVCNPSNQIEICAATIQS